MQALPAGGAMVAVAASEDEVMPLLGEGVGIAAINAPGSVTISGAEAAVSAIADRFAEQGRRVHRLAVSHAFHSPLMEPMLDEFARIAARFEPRTPQIGLVSNVTGELASAAGDFGSAPYWVDHVRRPVRFADSARHAQQLGATHFIEVGPGSGLTSAIEQSVSPAEAVVVSVLGKDRPELAAALGAAGQLFTTGVSVDWPAVFAGSGGRRVELPTYAFQRRRFWETPGADGPADAVGLGLGPTEHALLGAVVERPDADGVVLTGRLSLADQPWLADHVVGGVVLFPGAGFVELVIRAADEAGCAVIDELILAAPLVLHPGVGVKVQVVVGAADEAGTRSVSVYSRGDHCDGEWLLHAMGTLGESPRAGLGGLVGVAAGGCRDCRYFRWLRTVGRPRLCLRQGIPGAGGGLAARVGAVRRGGCARAARGGGRGDGDAPGRAGRGAACPGTGYRDHRDDAAVLLARCVAARGRRRAGTGPSRLGRSRCDLGRDRRCRGATGADCRRPGDPGDDGRAVTGRGERGRPRARPGTAGSGLVTNAIEPQQY
ncbi:acyl transferase domain protein [Mycobacterium kansasii 732]|nr:acyl transferase domain protein [Mycobacterium kansasii 732]